MLELVKSVERKILNEQGILDRTSKKVTIDWVETQAEVRKKAFCEDLDMVCNYILRSHGYKAKVCTQ